MIELMIVIAILSVLLLLMLPNFVRAKGRSRLTGCESNLRNTATAVEMYARDNGDDFPTAITQLTPNYLRSLQKCPAAEDTSSYINGFSSTRNPDRYTISCSGSNHLEVNLPDNYPMYTLDGALQEK